MVLQGRIQYYYCQFSPVSAYNRGFHNDRNYSNTIYFSVRWIGVCYKGKCKTLISGPRLVSLNRDFTEVPGEALGSQSFATNLPFVVLPMRSWDEVLKKFLFSSNEKWDAKQGNKNWKKIASILCFSLVAEILFFNRGSVSLTEVNFLYKSGAIYLLLTRWEEACEVTTSSWLKAPHQNGECLCYLKS